MNACMHPVPSRPQHEPYPWTTPQYSVAIQYDAPEVSPELLAGEITYIQQVIGKLYYYARAVYHMMLTSLGRIVST